MRDEYFNKNKKNREGREIEREREKAWNATRNAVSDYIVTLSTIPCRKQCKWSSKSGEKGGEWLIDWHRLVPILPRTRSRPERLTVEKGKEKETENASAHKSEKEREIEAYRLTDIHFPSAIN